MNTKLIVNANIVNEGTITEGDVLIKDGRIEKIASQIGDTNVSETVDANGKFLLPGVIDDQVHFREPGNTHKAEVYTESKAAVAGGVTSYMEMPNTNPQTITNKLLEEKFDLAAGKSLANHSFYLGATNENLDELLKVDVNNVCGIKVFMGSSTGNMLVDDAKALEKIFSESNVLIATHCEDEATIKKNEEIFRQKYGDNVPIKYHAEIRSEDACYKSSSFAVELAKKHNTRLHVLHISTAKELELFSNDELGNKRITSEACIHHMWFDSNDYHKKGTFIKWNPAVKKPSDKYAIFDAILNDRIDVIATDHAPHTLKEKQNNYFNAPSGGPLIQHSLVAMLEYYWHKKISVPHIVKKMCHDPALIFQIKERGFIREGYWADLVLVDTDDPWIVSRENLLYKCGWSPFEGELFHSRVTHTFVSGHLAYENGEFDESIKGKRLQFERP